MDYYVLFREDDLSDSKQIGDTYVSPRRFPLNEVSQERYNWRIHKVMLNCTNYIFICSCVFAIFNGNKRTASNRCDFEVSKTDEGPIFRYYFMLRHLHLIWVEFVVVMIQDISFVEFNLDSFFSNFSKLKVTFFFTFLDMYRETHGYTRRQKRLRLWLLVKETFDPSRTKYKEQVNI
jgi:hypothetical protein